MVLLSKFNEVPTDEHKGLSEEDNNKIRNAQYSIAELAFEFWTKEKKIKKRPLFTE